MKSLSPLSQGLNGRLNKVKYLTFVNLQGSEIAGLLAGFVSTKEPGAPAVAVPACCYSSRRTDLSSHQSRQA